MKIEIIRKVGIFSLFAFILFWGCEDMKDTYQQFTRDGEIVYIAKADSIKLKPGKSRIELSWLLISDPKVRSYKVYWNNGRDSVENTVTKTDKVDTVRLMLTNMKEEIHYFEIFMYDKYLNSSIKATAIGKVYGENYRASLFNRPYKSITRSGKNAIIQWTTAEAAVKLVEIQFLDAANALVTRITPGAVTTDTLKNIPVGGSFQYRTSFLPEPNAIDTFYTSPKTISLKSLGI